MSADAIYVHIPFCEHICHYCDFNKVYLKNQPVQAYLDVLLDEMRQEQETNPSPSIRTIYIGGGTPTALSASQLSYLVEGMKQIFPLDQLEEWTVEVNPDSAEADKLSVLFNAGVNRLSIGVQTFDHELLEMIGRTHRQDSVFEAIHTAREVGFQNLSIDLMFGLPKQTPESFAETLRLAYGLNIEHISAYSLKIEEKTVFYNRQRKGNLQLPPEEHEITMYQTLLSTTKQAGLTQYEISNFAKLGYESKHNLVYWNNESYFGFGAGASGYVNGVRYQNIGPINRYIQAVKDKELPRITSHVVTASERLEEAMFLGLRKRQGINPEEFQAKYHYRFEELYANQIQDLITRGLLEYQGTSLRLTDKGLLLGNEVFEAFLAVLEDDQLSLK
ncbi:radical SAM family heme chaperone HemW [Alkalicoccobacillus porphyridii]|uniref:Heme chaperone HemW n=1 Tax=Alkalicoccobacillus porphyridii TaxID=2597270 RepID=A0A553ZZE4_9BACI|nr:radical SAM family heme chaperone HemW [Alkalicoccobacillus porphyridii]TSB46776.1 oxygen-independent coproporphyrinogen III oxidase [Alkalicoccobacillus porphyridii]